MEVCTVSDCSLDKSNGDLLFCAMHRKMWKIFCIAQGIDDRIISKQIENKLLTSFQDQEQVDYEIRKTNMKDNF